MSHKRGHDADNDDGDAAPESTVEKGSKKAKRDARLARCIELSDRIDALALHNAKKAEIVYDLEIMTFDSVGGETRRHTKFSRVASLHDSPYFDVNITHLQDGQMYHVVLTIYLNNIAEPKMHKFISNPALFDWNTKLKFKIGQGPLVDDSHLYELEVDPKGASFPFSANTLYGLTPFKKTLTDEFVNVER